MAAFKSDFMRIVHERGMVHQCSDATRLDELLASGVRTAYIGFDCTADSLHVGSLLQIMMLRWWQKTGHRPITLMGGGGRLNDKPIAGDTVTVGEADLDSSGTLKLSAGRKRHVLVKAV